LPCSDGKIKGRFFVEQQAKQMFNIKKLDGEEVDD
jgi:hypothetical protein